MEGPSISLREDLSREIEELESQVEVEGITTTAEDRAVELLDEILTACENDVESDDFLNQDTLFGQHSDGAWPIYNQVQAWAGLASYTVARIYSPSSPWPEGLAGVATRIVEKLNQLTRVLSKVLRQLKTALGAFSFSIGINFPWSFSASLSFS